LIVGLVGGAHTAQAAPFTIENGAMIDGFGNGGLCYVDRDVREAIHCVFSGSGSGLDTLGHVFGVPDGLLIYTAEIGLGGPMRWPAMAYCRESSYRAFVWIEGTMTVRFATDKPVTPLALTLYSGSWLQPNEWSPPDIAHMGAATSWSSGITG
jgi:hypothetical protein